MPRSLLLRRSLLVTPLLLPQPAAAQPHPNKANGFSPEKAFHIGEIDSANAFNGSLVLTIPLRQSCIGSPAT